jgi:hypothetical protein
MKDKFTNVKNHLTSNWRKYAAGAAVVGGSYCAYRTVKEWKEFGDEYIKPEMDA